MGVRGQWTRRQLIAVGGQVTGNHQTIKPGAIVTSGSNAVRGVMVLWLGRGRAGPSVRPERPVMSAQVRSVMVLWFYRQKP
jgi:hypothetical protein